MTDPIDRLQAIKERIDVLMAAEVERAEKEKRERSAFDEKVASIERDLVMASALAALKAAATDVRHERVRVQVQGARELLHKALAG